MTHQPSDPADRETTEPMLDVVKGNPTAEELAAVAAVVLALQSGDVVAESTKPSRHWVRRAQLKLPPKPGAGSWRRSIG